MANTISSELLYYCICGVTDSGNCKVRDTVSSKKYVTLYQVKIPRIYTPQVIIILLLCMYNMHDEPHDTRSEWMPKYCTQLHTGELHIIIIIIGIYFESLYCHECI